LNAVDDKFCGGCGARLANAGRVPGVPAAPPEPLAEKARSSQSELEGQRRLVTVMVADMEGYTALAEAKGEEALYPLMQRVLKQMIAAVHEQEGTVQDLAGDGLLGLFGAPIALEDAPLRACRAALDIQARMSKLSREMEQSGDREFRVRIGIHTGQVVVGKIGDDLHMEFKALGDTVNLASRLEAAAESGTVVLSNATHLLVEGYVEANFLGERSLKGKSEPQALYQLIRLRDGVTRFDVAVGKGLTRLIGRDAEMNKLERCFEAAGRGEPQMVNLVGEAGIGKSRLVHDLRRRLEAEGVLFLQGHCQSHRQGAFLPFIEVVRTVFGITEGDPQADITRRLRAGLEIVGLDADEAVPHLLNLLGLHVEGRTFRKEDSELAGQRVRDILQRLLLERSRLSPVVLFIDDLHWIDPPSEDYLCWLADVESELPILAVCAYRPHYVPPWAERSNVTEIRLEPLPRGCALDILRHRFGTEDLPAELVRLVLSKAEGNPLFVEEVANYLVEKGCVRERDGRIEFDALSDDAGLPATLQNLLMERVDRLPDQSRSILRAAAVVGRRFPVDVVRLACGLERSAVEQRMRELERQELIFLNRDEYQFKHALIQDAVYESLLATQREDLHEKVAVAIEGLNADRLGEVADALARHYGETARAEKAALYMALAGEKSLRVYSLEEAHRFFAQVVELCERVPGCANEAFLTDVLLNLARVHYFRADFSALIKMASQYLPMVEELGDPRRLSRFLVEIGYAYMFAAQPSQGQPHLERALALAEASGDEEGTGYASMGLMWRWVFWEPAVEESRQNVARLAGRAVEIGTRLEDVWLTMKGLSGIALSWAFAGRPAEARQASLRLLELSRETGDPRPQGMGLYCLSIANTISLELEEGVRNAEEALRISLAPLDRLTAVTFKAFALTLQDRSDEALSIGVDAKSELLEKAYISPLTILELALGGAMAVRGDLTEAVRSLTAARSWLADHGHPMGPFGCDLVLGEIYLRMALREELPPWRALLRNLPFLVRTLPFATRKAQAHFEAAAEGFGRIDSPVFRSWSLYDLGRTKQRRKRHAEARECLEEALAIAREVGAGALAAKIEAALATGPAA
jgi:class 3 adenylate cyclase/tetratricopeptide (TPR) repeat protein